MPDQDGDQDQNGGAESGGDPPLSESARGVLPATNDAIAVGWTLFAIATSGFLLSENGTLPLWLATADFVSIVATVYFAYGKGAFSAAGGYAKRVIND